MQMPANIEAVENHYVFPFNEGDGKNKKLLGGKGANLCEMTQIGLNVPPGFVISTEACLKYLENPVKTLPDSLMEEVGKNIHKLEQTTGKGFGDTENPLLVSVRSGSALSMPGMMDTILNLGLNATTLQGLIKQTNNERFSYDAYRRFIQLFGKVALGIPDEPFDAILEQGKKLCGAAQDVDLTTEDLKNICQQYLDKIQAETGKPFPEDVYEQLHLATKAVFNSWMGKRAVDYRREFHITSDKANGTAVNICTMVFGNMGNDSATGVAFTRNPGTGENKLFGEYLVNAQGEDVVAGIRTPKPIDELANEMPEMHKQLQELRNHLESHYHEIQDFEFTIEKGVLYCLQTRNGKMNASAMVKTSIELVNEGMISQQQALLRIPPSMLDQLLFPRLKPNHGATPIAKGIAASPGACCGKIIFDADRAEEQGRLGEKIILVREETKPEDIHGFFASQGILTSRGGKTSHAAVVARGMGKPCVAGAEGINVDVEIRKAFVGDHVLHEGDIITLDGGSGEVYLGEVDTVDAEFSQDLETLLSWADSYATLAIMANADTGEDAKRALSFGAQGVGLCRTERMFNAVDRLPIVINMILADSDEERQQALAQLLPIQRQDFMDLFQVMSPRPVTIRLLDPPIHEFLPTENQLINEIAHLKHLRNTVEGMEELGDTIKLLDPQLHAKYVGELDQIQGSLKELRAKHLDEQVLHEKEVVLEKVKMLHETNPMLGHRGVRLGITHPDIYAMQIQAVLEATAECLKQGIDVHPEIMVPQVCTEMELAFVKRIYNDLLKQVQEQYDIEIPVKFGSMIEVVRACMRAGHIAHTAEFFSFGTNDLSQAVFSFSREDAENKFLPLYNESGILQDNPFEVLDVKGVGRLMKITVEWGRKTRPELKVGICGEQGGQPDSIRFCHHIGLTYASCSAPRVPIARLAAAQAKLLEDEYVYD